MLIAFLAGVLLSGMVGWFFWFSCRREAVRLDEEKQRLTQEKQIVLEFMHNLVEAIGEGVSREELFRRVVHAAVLSTGALSAALFVRTPEGQLRGVAVEGLFPPQKPLPEGFASKAASRAKFLEQVLRSETFEPGEGLIGSVAQSGKGVRINHAGQDPRVVRHDDPSLQIHSILVVPMRFRETLIGVLAVANPSNYQTFSETDFSLCQSLAEQSGLAIHNLDLMALQIEKNKMDVDLALASSIQGMLLPRIFPDTPELDLDAFYQPAQKVGGDLYDVFQLPNGRVAVAIADVSGKGIPASLLMAICQSNLRHLARQYTSPSRVLTELNMVMSEEMRQDMFVTILFAVIDPLAQVITFARAGHELPILLRQTNPGGPLQPAPTGSEGMALGMAAAELFASILQEQTVPFRPGDVFLLYTDGVTEAHNSDGVEFSASRLADTVCHLAHRPAREINQGILEAITHYTGSDQHADDITLVTVRHKLRQISPPTALG